VHVNIALIVKFMANYFFSHKEYPTIPRQDEARNDDFLFHQGPASGLSKIQFHDYTPIFECHSVPNVMIFKDQLDTFKKMLAQATPSEDQLKDTDFLLTLGEAFTQAVYGQLILENADEYSIDDDLVDQIFDFMVRDLSTFALRLYSQAHTTSEQMNFCLQMIRRPAVDPARFTRVWQEQVFPLKDAYEMNP
jgi:acyl-CoA dehydrogenase